ncbi:MAG: hypothetical protein M1829_003273 [Trizodia sp. TS-e1964]|nr:MAG: hypothetical protein M1829_003273 [Trizodia sp. TS-e1964]
MQRTGSVSGAGLPRPPSIAMKPPGPSSDSYLTPIPMVINKEWVVPPRAKPGRKPATDVPATKRKAQNREAQRAFRERRAARAGELEERLKEVEVVVEQKEACLISTIKQLESEIKRFQLQISEWQFKYENLKQEAEYERREKDRFKRDLDILLGGAMPTSNNTIPNQPSSSTQNDQQLLGCGECSSDTRCKCVEQIVNSQMAFFDEGSSANPKRPRTLSPYTASTKRARPSQKVQNDSVIMETDFTTLYASKDSDTGANSKTDHEQVARNSINEISSDDPCGFCQDGTPCICAELELNSKLTCDKTNEVGANRLTPILSQFTPPPDVQPSLQKMCPSFQQSRPALNCRSGAGTCAQCLEDPARTLFCKSLAAIRPNGHSSSESSKGGCCGSAIRDSCCLSSQSTSSGGNAASKPFISCADAYTTLSRHPHFNQASDDLNSWVGKLSEAVKDGNHKQTHHPMEIEAASVMGVLKFFDRRFGKG